MDGRTHTGGTSVTEQIDLVRKKDTGEPGNGGQFGSHGKGASQLSLHGTGPRAGTAIFPPPFGGWAAEDFIEWWENVPLDDDSVLMNVQREYKLKWEERRSAYASPKYDEWLQANPNRGSKDTFKYAEWWAKESMAVWNRLNDEFEAMYPNRLPDTRVRGVCRAFKMWQYSAQLDATEEEIVDPGQPGRKRRPGAQSLSGCSNATERTPGTPDRA